MPALGVATLLGFTGYAALLPVAPLWAVRGGADLAGAGLVNGVLLLATVLTQGFIPGALARHGWGRVLTAGMLLQGLPSLATAVSDSLAWILGWAVVRGMGFAILTVCGSSAVAELVEPHRRGAGIGAYGLAIAVPNVLILSISPWLAEHIGFTAVFIIGAMPIAAIPAALALARHLHAVSVSLGAGNPSAAEPAAGSATDSSAPSGSEPTGHAGGSTGHRSRGGLWRALLPPSAILLSVTLAGGGVLTFLPQMVADPGWVMAALFSFNVMATISRWLIGTMADKRGAAVFVVPLLFCAVMGLGLIAWAVRSTSAPAGWALIAGVLAAGLAYGALQNITLLLAFAAVRRDQFGTASAVWNVGFDLGTGLGSVLVGLLAARAGFPISMLILGAICATALPLALRAFPASDRRP